jgi:hypothetical protein
MFERLDYVVLENMLAELLLGFFPWLRQQITAESLYVFGLYTEQEGVYILPTCNTEEALKRKATSVSAHTRVRALDLCREIRWNPPDWDYHLKGEAHFDGINTYLQQAWTDDYSEFRADSIRIHEACIQSLLRLQDTLALTSDERTSLTFGVFIGGQPSSQMLEFLRRCNAPEVIQKIEAELR